MHARASPQADAGWKMERALVKFPTREQPEEKRAGTVGHTPLRNRFCPEDEKTEAYCYDKKGGKFW